MKYLVSSIDDWQMIAEAVAKKLKPGSVLALSGPLGAGKTTFVQALADVLGSHSRPKSPTFSLIRRYTLHAPRYTFSRLLHLDAYRIEKPADLLPLNLDEELQEDGTTLAIEWPENATTWIKKQKHVLLMKIEIKKDGTRTVTLTS